MITSQSNIWDIQSLASFQQAKLLIDSNQTQVVREIFFEFEGQVNIPKQLRNTQFINLKKLSLWENRLCNIEFIQTIKANNLQQLYLNNNDLIQIRSLQKCDFPLLKIFQSYQNLSTDYKFICKMKLDKQELNLLICNYYLKKQPQIDLSFLIRQLVLTHYETLYSKRTLQFIMKRLQ